MSRAKDYVIEIDGENYQYTGVFYMNGWYAVTNADTAEIMIEDKNNAKIIHGKSAITNERMIYGPALASPTRVENLKGLIWTNIERVIIHIAKFGDASSA